MSLYNMTNWKTPFKNKICCWIDNFISYQTIYMPPWVGVYYWVNFDLVKHAEKPYYILKGFHMLFREAFCYAFIFSLQF